MKRLAPALATLLWASWACAATIREEAGRAEARISREEARRLLGRAWDQLDRGKRIFDIRLAGRGRVLNGEGAIVYEKRPLRVRLDVFGPHSTLLLSLAQREDSIFIRLPEERRFLEGRVGDPAIAELTEGRAFTGHELLGALLGAYDAGALTGGSADTVAYGTGGNRVVALLEPGRAHRFSYAGADSTLREYRQERGGRAAYRARFSDYRVLDGKRRPFRVDLEDLSERRTLRVKVRSETFDAELPDDAYRLTPF